MTSCTVTIYKARSGRTEHRPVVDMLSSYRSDDSPLNEIFGILKVFQFLSQAFIYFIVYQILISHQLCARNSYSYYKYRSEQNWQKS